jgi:hypothetical protein
LSDCRSGDCLSRRSGAGHRVRIFSEEIARRVEATAV